MAKVRAVDIARMLNISKATVSLALNGKPGVSEETREEVRRCYVRLLHEDEANVPPENVRYPALDDRVYPAAGSAVPTASRIIKVITVDGHQHVAINSEMDLRTGVLKEFSRECSRLNYTLALSYVDLDSNEAANAVREANQEEVLGVIVIATEMMAEDAKLFRGIRRPMVIYDNDLSDHHSCVIIDNVGASSMAVDYLVRRGRKDICYLGNTKDIFNFRQRRAGFRNAVIRNGLKLREDSIREIGSTIDDVYENMKRLIEEGCRLPEAFLFENYQVSAGVMRALREKNIRVPEDISLIGIDELPSYVETPYRLTTIRISHAERGKIAMLLLEQEIMGAITRKFKVLSNCELIQGESVSGEKVIKNLQTSGDTDLSAPAGI